ncbi:MAG TPA: hypothetical protein VFI27_10430 [candidate division Zixibacteria bacterium]|nr:hypothetical protein [candidate division Zixibacteria bacterium]
MNSATKVGERRLRVIFSSILAVVLTVIVFQFLFAQELEVLPPDLSGSIKEVDKEEALPGSQLQYSVIISNSGNQPAFDVALTDTLSSETTYISGSLSVSGGGLYGESNGVITWTGAVNNDAQIVINFDARLSDTIASGTSVTNTAVVAYNGSSIELPATTNVVSQTESFVYLPIIAKSLPLVTVNQIGRPTSANSWRVTWSVSDPIGTTGYEIQEDNDSNFPNPSYYDTGSSQLYLDRQPPVSNINVYFYRVRAVGVYGVGEWSKPRAVVANYRDDFNNPGTGWTMRREDTDHIENQTRYENGEFVHEMDSSWDYLLSGPMAFIPTPPYRITMRARHVEPGNLNSYGIIFGGDWDAQSGCPAPDFSTCFNQYYRLNMIWFGDDPSSPQLRAVLKRIDSHDPRNNHGRGETLISMDVGVNHPSSGFQEWSVEVYPNGTIRLFENGTFFAETVDTNYIDQPYFGSFSSTDEYAGLEAHFDWFEVTALP